MPGRNPHPRPLTYALLLLCACSLAACNLPGRQSQTATMGAYSTQTLEALSTQSALDAAPIASPTLMPTRTITPIPPPPSPTPWYVSLPTQVMASVPTQQAAQIVFFAGGTSEYEDGTLEAGEIKSYFLSANAGQTLLAGVASSGKDVYLQIEGLSTNETLVNFSEERLDWSGSLPFTQTYRISLATSMQADDFFLSIEIPANVAYESGVQQRTIEGFIEVFKDRYPDLPTRVRYLVLAAPEHTLTGIHLASPQIGHLSIGVIGQEDGQPYKRFEVKGNDFTGELPLTQGYYVDVYSLGMISTDYTLTLEWD